jgi:hypothetical protein
MEPIAEFDARYSAPGAAATHWAGLSGSVRASSARSAA